MDWPSMWATDSHSVNVYANPTVIREKGVLFCRKFVHKGPVVESLCIVHAVVGIKHHILDNDCSIQMIQTQILHF